MRCPRCNSNITYVDEDHSFACAYCGYRPTRETKYDDTLTNKVKLPVGKNVH